MECRLTFTLPHVSHASPAGREVGEDQCCGNRLVAHLVQFSFVERLGMRHEGNVIVGLFLCSWAALHFRKGRPATSDDVLVVQARATTAPN